MDLALAMPGGEIAKNKKVSVSEITFGREFNEPLIHQVVTAYLAGRRAGTRAQKTRSEVRGGGIKPWKQKGTGRARAGTISSPLWRTGGRTFAAKPQDHSQKVNKKMYKGAICSILSELVRQQRLLIIREEDIKLEVPKTRELLNRIKNFGLKEALIIVGDWDVNLYLASRNLPKVEVREARKIDPVSLIKFDKVIITESAIRKIEEVLG